VRLRKFSVLAASAATAVALGASAAVAPSASADPLNGLSPSGANDWSCVPSAAHPYPVVLVPGTFENMFKNYQVLSPIIKSAGYCVFALNYGEDPDTGVDATGPVGDSAKELGMFADKVLNATKASKVDLVGHSQGGMMPRYFLKFLGGAAKTDELIGIAPSNHGTQGLIVPMAAADGSTQESLAPTGGTASPDSFANPCQACTDQGAGSAFLKNLNAGGDTVPGPDYTVISTTHDEVVTPYTSQALDGPPDRVTNVVIQNLCPTDPIEHDQSPNDPVVAQLVLNALGRPGPLDKTFQPDCTALLVSGAGGTPSNTLPEAPLALLLPLAGAGVAAVAIRRRRRTAA